MQVLNAEQMRAADRHATATLGIPAAVLMECAGVEVVRAIAATLKGAEALASLRVLVLCGRGNNGGDGMVVARRLAGLGAEVRAVLLGDPASLSEEARRQRGILEQLGLPLMTCGDDDWAELADELDEGAVDLVVDALLGTGFRGPLTGLMARAVEDLNASPVPVVAIDVPSGLSADSGELSGPAVEAALTVALAAPKTCHVFAPAMTRCGDVAIVEIGIPEESLDAAGSTIELVEDELVGELVEELADRPEDSHKGSYGHVVVVGGALGSSGAAALAGRGALTAGCGLVTVATPLPCVSTVAAHAPELMQLALPADGEGAVGDAVGRAEAILARADVLVIGPGLGRGPGAEALLQRLLELARIPVVLDADALNLLAAAGRLPEPREDRPLVLTPHPGELARLVAGLGSKGPEASGPPAPGGIDSRLVAARELARRHALWLVLKGFRTVVALPNGELHVNPTGGPGLATAGSGDVLAGCLGGLLAQGLGPEAACVAAVFLHGRAGDLGELELGQMSLTASGLLAHWPAALRSVLGETESAAEPA